MEKMDSYFIKGIPIPKGSARAMKGVPYGPRCPRCKRQAEGYPRVFAANKKLKPWERTIRGTTRAMMSFHDIEKREGPVSITLEFYMPRVKSHYGTGRNAGKLKASAPLLHTKKPDLDKLVRAVFDGLTDLLYNDDCTVVAMNAEKRYIDEENPEPGVKVTIQ